MLIKKLKSFLYQKAHNLSSKDGYINVLYSGENITGYSHLDLWIPYFKQSNVKFFIIVRNKKLYNKLINDFSDLSIVYIKKGKYINKFLSRFKDLKAVFYPSNTGNNIFLLENSKLKHIFIGHGDSDKTASAHKFFRVYDENWTAGEAHIDRFRNAGFDFSGLIFKKVGRPTLKDVLATSDTPWESRYNGKIKLLYLSTWEGFWIEQDYTSVYIIDDILSSLYSHYKSLDISIKLHPWTGKRNKNLLNVHNNLSKYKCTIYTKEKPVNELIANANIFICDISAVVSECLSANGPIFVYIPKDKNIKLSSSKMSYSDYTYTFSSPTEFIEKFKEVISGNDYLADNRKKAMEYILGKEETLNNQFIKELQNIKEDSDVN
jgi:hypothetical protein